MTPRGAGWGRVLLAAIGFSAMCAAGVTSALAAPPAKEIARRSAGPVAVDVVESPLRLEGPYHGDLDAFAWGGYGELRFAEDRVRGVTDPEWFSFGSVGAFLRARASSRIQLGGEAAWDRGADDFSFERVEVDVLLRGSTHLHAGIFPTPLGRTNQFHDAPRCEFDERSLVATQLIGVPNSQIGAGIRGVRRGAKGWPLSYEVDLVTGYDDGLIMDSPGGTRLPRGRNNYGDNNAVPALAARLAVHPTPSSELGIAAQSGQYNQTRIGGVRVDQARYVHVAIADWTSGTARFHVSSEAAVALIDVPPGLGTLFANSQWGASVELSRTLLEPIFGGWRRSSLTGALRVDAVDFDRAIQGDSRMRLSASLNLHHLPGAVSRFGWYYEIRRDRFNNETPTAGITLTAATYF